MTPAAYQQALQLRGFTYNSGASVWVGPFGIRVTGMLNEDPISSTSIRAIDHGFARAAKILEVDEKLRAKRGLARGPLVEPQEPYNPAFQPYVQIQTPGAYPPQQPTYPPHQKNLPPPPPILPTAPQQ